MLLLPYCLTNLIQVNYNNRSTKTRVTKEGQPCRKCGTPVIKIYRKNNKVTPNQTYYYNSWLKCKGCNTMYMLESEKVIVDANDVEIEIDINVKIKTKRIKR